MKMCGGRVVRMGRVVVRGPVVDMNVRVSVPVMMVLMYMDALPGCLTDAPRADRDEYQAHQPLAPAGQAIDGKHFAQTERHETHDDDPTGVKAFRVCFNEPLSEIEKQWRAWAHRRPKVDVAIDSGDAALGIESDLHASNDGVLIADVIPGSAAAAGDLEAGDVIVAVDGRPTRSLTELQTIIAAKAVGDRVTVRARRNGDYFTVVVRLRPL